MRSLSIVALFTAVACASAPMATKSEDESAKRLDVAANESAIYVIRSTGIGSTFLTDVHVDGALVAQLPVKAYTVAKVLPGNHRIQTSAPSSGAHAVDVDARGGVASFVVINSLGQARLVDEKRGAEELLSCRLVQRMAR